MAVATLQAACISLDVPTEKIAVSADWKPVHSNDPHVIEIAKFAVAEFNVDHPIPGLVFEKVVSGWSLQIDIKSIELTAEGTLYKLLLTASTLVTNGTKCTNKYQTLVYEAKCGKKTLIYFTPLPPLV